MRKLILIPMMILSVSLFGQSPMSRLVAKKATAAGCGDSDAQAFITAAGISGTEADAICTLVTDLKAEGLWSNFIAIYPFVGGTAAAHKWNLKDPRDLDAAYRLTFHNTWTHNSSGATPNSGASAYAKTYLLGDVLSQNSTHLSYYTPSNINETSTEMGYSGTSSLETSVVLYAADFYALANSTSYAFYNISSTVGYFMSNRIDATYVRAVLNGTQVSYTYNTSVSPQAIEITLGVRNDNGTRTYFSTKTISFASIGSGIPEAQTDELNTIVEAFQDALSRGVQ